VASKDITPSFHRLILTRGSRNAVWCGLVQFGVVWSVSEVTLRRRRRQARSSDARRSRRLACPARMAALAASVRGFPIFEARIFSLASLGRGVGSRESAGASHGSLPKPSLRGVEPGLPLSQPLHEVSEETPL